MNKEQLKIFKRQTRGFIQWVNKEEGIDVREDCRKITFAKTSEEVQAVLSLHDDGSFLQMVAAGCF